MAMSSICDPMTLSWWKRRRGLCALLFFLLCTTLLLLRWNISNSVNDAEHKALPGGMRSNALPSPLRQEQKISRNNSNTERKGNQMAKLQDRLVRVREHCGRLRSSVGKRDIALHPPDSLIVNEEHRIIYCNAPKVGCTNWKIVFLKLGGFDKYNISAMDHLGPNKKGKIYLDYIHKYTNISHRRFMLRNFTKFMFVRHPFTRILSAFRNKLAPNISFHFRNNDEKARWVSNYGKTIIEKYRGKKEAKRVSSDWDKEYDLTFSEFVRFLVDPDTDSFNKHWSEISSLCLPCDVDYDIIGKYETLDEDAEYVLRLAGVDPGIRYPTPQPWTVTNSSDPRMADRYYKEVPREYLDKLIELYSTDFELFGYDPDPYLDL